MQYLCLIYNTERNFETLSEAEKGQIFTDYMGFTKSIAQSGHLRGGEALQPVATATTLRKEGDKVIPTDGPYAETKEQLGGYYLIEAKDLDEALEIGGRIPEVKYGGAVEVRPIMETPKAE